MYVCLCKGITDWQIRDAADCGASSLADLSDHLGLATECGSCAASARDVLDAHRGDDVPGSDRVPSHG